MKLIAILAGPRAGIDFLQSLFDKHPEILQFPGYFYFDDFWKKIEKQNTLKNIANTFISDYEKFFDSRVNLIERHHMLGKDKNGFFLVDKNKFFESFINLFRNKEINKRNVLYNLHFAYSQALDEDLQKKKIVILNVHQFFRLKVLNGINYEVIHTIRDPVAALCAQVKHWLNYEDGKHVSPWQLHFFIDRAFNGLKTLTQLKTKIHVIQLELLHTQNTKVMKEMAKRLDISYNQSLTQSTYHGKLWWGDAVGGRDLNGVNPNFKNNIDYSFFYKKDILCLEKYLKAFMIRYNYPISEKKLKFSIIKILPLKIEIKVWKKMLSYRNTREILSFFKYWVKRVNLMKSNMYDNVDFPDPIGK